jgi:hypothetical protein
MDLTIQDLKNLRNDYIKNIYGISFYPFQYEISDQIITSLREGIGDEIGFAVSRQAGKTTAIVYTVAFLMAFNKYVLDHPLRIAIFAPQREQTKTDFDLLKEAMDKAGEGGVEMIADPDESNAVTFKLNNGAVCYTFPLTETSKIESKTVDLAIFEEANSIDDIQKRKKAEPMTTSTNAPEISVGVAGYRKNYFEKMWSTGKVRIYDYNRIIKEKRDAYEKDKKDFHLNYERKIRQKKHEWGENNDEFKTQYKLQWVLGGGQFITLDDFDKMVGDFSITNQAQDGDFYVGIDTAKFPDSTVVTIIKAEPKRIVNWLELQGDNYEDQFEIIHNFLNNYNIRAVAIDATAQGDFMPDKFERHTQWSDEFNGLYRVKFSLVTKDIMYKNLNVVCKEFLTQVPKIETMKAERFKEQMLNLQKEYRGELLNCHHPDDPQAHDDYCDSWALAEYAFMKETQKPEPSISFV